jgi:transcriptional regulator GlxA family with amidase domain
MATTHYLAMDKLITQYPRITAHKVKRFVDNGRIITTEGVSAGIDGALCLVEKMFNKNASKDIAEYIMYNWKPESLDVTSNNNSQSCTIS